MKPICALAAIYALLLASPAYAYLDPVTGSFVLQAIIGGIASAMIAIRRVREKILTMVGVRTSDENERRLKEDSANQ